MAEVLLADDSGFMRNLLREIPQEDNTVVGEIGNGATAVEVFSEERSWTAFAGGQVEAALDQLLVRADRLTADAKQII